MHGLQNNIAQLCYHMQRDTRGRGVTTLTMKDIPFIITPEASDVEAIFCKLIFGSRSVMVGCVYQSLIYRPASLHG